MSLRAAPRGAGQAVPRCLLMPPPRPGPLPVTTWMWHPCRPDDMDVALMSLPEAGAGDWRGHRGRCGSRDPGMTATAAIEIIRRVGGRRGGDVTRSLPGLRRAGGTDGQL